MTGRASGPQERFKLSFPVSDPSQITVTVDGQAVGGDAWSFDPLTNSIVFAPGSVPAEGQTIEVSYVGDCSVVTQ